ncbi:cAMP-specific 3',5'-cyclic phosphodiesterase 4D isoform X2 [Tachysurus ichikawai]
MSGTQEEDSSVITAQAIKLKPRSSGGSPCESPNTKLSPRNSPRNSPVLFRKLLMNRSIVLQRRFTLAYTPRAFVVISVTLPVLFCISCSFEHHEEACNHKTLWCCLGILLVKAEDVFLQQAIIWSKEKSLLFCVRFRPFLLPQVLEFSVH